MADTTTTTTVDIGNISKQLTEASRVVVSTDGFWVQTGGGQSVRIPAEFVRAYLLAGVAVSVNSDGYWVVGDTTTKVKAEGKDGTPKIVEQTEGIVSIDPGVLNVWTVAVDTLAVTFNDPTDTTLANEYMMRFTTGSATPTISLPSTISWNETPQWEASTTYEISVVGGYGVVASFK